MITYTFSDPILAFKAELLKHFKTVTVHTRGQMVESVDVEPIDATDEATVRAAAGKIGLAVQSITPTSASF